MSKAPKHRRAQLTLGDLVMAVSSESRSGREAAAAITDLFRRGRVALGNGRRRIRVTL